MKKFADSLKLYLTQYREVTAVAQFSFNLNALTHFLLSHGAERNMVLLTKVSSAECAVTIFY
jgi:F-type H+-transporting ATPase subunit alpha